MDGINWGGLVQRRNFFDELADGLSKGEGIRLERQRNDMLQQRQQFEMDEAQRKAAKEAALEARQKNVGAAVAKGDYAGARNAAEGDFDMLKSIGELDEAQRKQAAERSGVLVAYIDSLEGKTPEDIKAQIMQDAPALMELGYTQEQLTNFQPSPGVLAKMRAEALGLKGLLEQRDREADNARADNQAKEAERHNRQSEKTAAQNSSIAAGGLAVRRAAHAARLAAGGYGTPGVGSTGVPDDDVEID